MNVLSLFDGMSCGQIALSRLGIKVDRYYASEIKPHAIRVTKHNFPNTIHIGDVTLASYENGVLYTEEGTFEVGRIDLLIGGSPCQDLSIAQRDRTSLDGKKSSLFWEYTRLLREIKPDYFLLENVASAPKEAIRTITAELLVAPVKINSSLLSAQLRNRLYWTNVPNNGVPKDKGILFKDILESGYTDRKKSLCLMARSYLACPRGDTKNKHLFKRQQKSFVSVKWSCEEMSEDSILMLTRTEMERLQTVPEGYTNSVSFLEASNLLGDGWTVDVICHLLDKLKP